MGTLKQVQGYGIYTLHALARKVVRLVPFEVQKTRVISSKRRISCAVGLSPICKQSIKTEAPLKRRFPCARSYWSMVRIPKVNTDFIPIL
jgi:hypothetical protein